ncbi:MAG TPA: DUF5615 family PIN-like protein [Blastocatellia bacterium]
MSVGLYMDVHIPFAITVELRLLGADVLTSQEDGTSESDDPALLERASKLGRVLFTHDDDLLKEAARRQQTGEKFAGVVYAQRALGLAA